MKIAEAATSKTDKKNVSQQPFFQNILLPLLCILFVAALIIVCNGGIRIGFSNHSGLLPVVRRLLDATYLPGDFNIQLRLYHHRTFAFLIAGFSKLLGENHALLALSILGNLLLSASLYSLSQVLKLSKLAFLAIGVIVAMNVGFAGHGLELNTFIGNREIQPPTFAHAFVLFGVAALLEERLRFAAFFAGLSLFFHLQIGFALALMLLPFLVWRLKSSGMKEAFICGSLFLLPVAFTLFDISQMINRGLLRLPFTRADIDFRQPHHFEVGSWEAALWIAGYIILQAAIWLWFKRVGSDQKRGAFVLLVMSLLITALSLLHYADYYIIQSNRIAKFQMLRMSCFITVFGVIAVVLLLNQMPKSKRAAITINLTMIALATVLYLYPATRQGAAYSFNVAYYAEQKTAWVSVCLWIKEHTPMNAVFIMPPGEEGFTYLASRSNIGDFKTNPDGPQYLAEWYERLRDLAGGTLPPGKGFDNFTLLNQAYAGLSNEQLIELGKKYRAAFALLPKKSPAQLEIVYENNAYKVVRLSPEE